MSLLRRRRLIALTLACSLVLAAAPPTGLAAVRKGKDTQMRVAFVLNGKTLSLRLLSGANKKRSNALLPKTTTLIWGKKLNVVCGKVNRSKKPVGKLANRRFTWKANRKQVKVRLGQDVSGKANFCLLERRWGGDDIAVAFFGEAAAKKR